MKRKRELTVNLVERHTTKSVTLVRTLYIRRLPVTATMINYRRGRAGRSAKQRRKGTLLSIREYQQCYCHRCYPLSLLPLLLLLRYIKLVQLLRQLIFTLKRSLRRRPCFLWFESNTMMYNMLLLSRKCVRVHACRDQLRSYTQLHTPTQTLYRVYKRALSTRVFMWHFACACVFFSYVCMDGEQAGLGLEKNAYISGACALCLSVCLSVLSCVHNRRRTCV